MNDMPGLHELRETLLGDRSYPVVVVGRAEVGGRPAQPAIAPRELRRVMGEQGSIYFVPGEHLLRSLRGDLGRDLALTTGAVRVYWPGLRARHHPDSHPLVPVLPDEPLWATLAAFTRAFDLSRPHVREEISQIEDMRSLADVRRQDLEARLAEAESKLRIAQYELHRQCTRANEAERQARRPVPQGGVE